MTPNSQPLVKDSTLLASTLHALQSGAEEAFPKCAAILNTRLLDTELCVLSYVNSQPYEGGSWYRPIHNLIVTMAMIKICESTHASRDLVLAAILHDVGYSALEMPGTLQGAAWEGSDVRLAHMAAGRALSEQYLQQLRDAGTLVISDARLQTILSIIATHDNPYIGKPLIDKEALLHRDADRLFVLSCVSFWKDYIALRSDSTKLDRLQQARIEATPQTLLELRRASFIADPSNQLSYMSEFEPMTSNFAQTFFELQHTKRLDEVSSVLSLAGTNESKTQLPELTLFFTNSIVAEFEALAK